MSIVLRNTAVLYFCLAFSFLGSQEGTSSTNGSGAVVIRRMNPRGGQLLRSKAQESDSLDQNESRLPPVDTMEACNKAAER